MKRIKFCFWGLIFLWLLSSCTITLSRPAGNPQVPVASALSQIAEASPTRTPKPTATAYPTPTRRPTSTEPSTLTPASNLVLQPSSTPPVLIERGPSPTASQTSVHFSNITSTPEPLKCAVKDTYPAFGQDFKPRTDFKAAWRVYNVGTAPWGLEDILFDFVGGDRLQSQDRGATFIGFTVYVKDKINLEVRMKSPKQPGRYSTTWGLRRSNKREPFCTFSITIDVVK